VACNGLAATGLALFGAVFRTHLLINFVLAWGFGVVFQYFTIAPMRGLGVGEGLIAAVSADTISILAFQAGMSAWMAVTYFGLFPMHISRHPTLCSGS
jgi:hypothetical protein